MRARQVRGRGVKSMHHVLWVIKRLLVDGVYYKFQTFGGTHQQPGAVLDPKDRGRIRHSPFQGGYLAVDRQAYKQKF